MANTNINIRMDADLKRQFEAFCADMGMTMTTAFNVFARKAVREYRIPFEISGDVPNAETVEAIKEVKRMKADPSLGTVTAIPFPFLSSKWPFLSKDPSGKISR
jgi:DNA-damage-inducible protein J